MQITWIWIVWHAASGFVRDSPSPAAQTFFVSIVPLHRLFFARPSFDLFRSVAWTSWPFALSPIGFFCSFLLGFGFLLFRVSQNSRVGSCLWFSSNSLGPLRFLGFVAFHVFLLSPSLGLWSIFRFGPGAPFPLFFVPRLASQLWFRKLDTSNCLGSTLMKCR